MLTEKNVLLLLSFTISCNGFFWQNNQAPPQQQAAQPQPDYYKQVPISYFRTYTYQPLSYPPTPYTPVQTYPVTTRLYPNNMPINNWQRQSQLVSNGMPQPQQMQPQQMQLQSMPQQPQIPQQQQQQQQPPQLSQSPQPIQSEFVPQQLQQQTQQIKPSPPAPSMYGGQPDSYNYQYLPTVTPMNVQHVQFVPCMCPVTVTVSSSPDMLSADKRTDELTTSESNDSISILSVDEKSSNLNNL